MPVLSPDNPQDRQSYQEYLKNAPGNALWQSLPWESYQRALGRETRLYGLLGGEMRQGQGQGWKATALVLIDRTRGNLAVWDIPRGPVGEPKAAAELLRGIVEDAKREGAMAVYFSPMKERLEVRGPAFAKATAGKQRSERREQPEATVILDLTLSDDELLMQMHEKCRYNIRLAEKRGVVVKESRDVEAFYGLLRETASRDGFIVKPRSHYEKFLSDLPGSFLLLAYEAASDKRQAISTNSTNELPASRFPLTTPIAGLLGVTWGDRGYYYYGASAYKHRALMAPYLLQFAAMRLCREKGCTEYDLLGIERSEIRNQRSVHADLSPLTSHRSWSGLTRFKLQFGGRIEEYPPEQVIILRPLLFRVLSWKRAIFG